MAEHRTGVGVERVGPLIAMLGILPARLVRQDVRLGALVEGHHLGVGQRSGDLVLLFGRQRIDALDEQLARVQRLLPRLGQAHGCLLYTSRCV